MDLKLSQLFEPLYTVGDDGLPVLKIFLGGEWVQAKGKKTFPVKTPIDESVIARSQDSELADAARAIDIAFDVRQEVRGMAAIDRIDIFRKAVKLTGEHLEDLARSLTYEAGKPTRNAKGEVEATMDRMELTLEEASRVRGEYIPGDWSEDTKGKMGLVVREPVGVVVAISPFNYPLYIAAAKIIPAILSGNAVVAKPASKTPLTLLLFARILEMSGVPSGALNVITGVGKSVGDTLIGSSKVGMITFTGSTEVGRYIASKAGVMKLHLELGGKGTALVMEDADLDLAAKKCVDGSLRFCGQRCDAVSRILVVDSVAESFVEKVLSEVAHWRLGDPRDPETTIGPVIDAASAERIGGLVEDAVKHKAKLLCGGKWKESYFEPTVLDHVPLEARIAWEETFGPVVTIIRVDGEEEALDIANRSCYGLDSCVFTNDFYRMWRIVKRLQVGEVTVNDLPTHGVGYFPFGGVKDSGLGREGIGYSIDEMTNLKTVIFNLKPAKLRKADREG